MNPRAAINDLHPFQGCPFGLLGTSPQLLLCFKKVIHLIRAGLVFQKLSYLIRKRREWDSNPRALADKRFSRPPRYDHFDISPYSILFCSVLSSSANAILSVNCKSVNTFFKKILHKVKSFFFSALCKSYNTFLFAKSNLAIVLQYALSCQC